MRQDYQTAYLDAVRNIAAHSAKVYLASGEELRARSGKAAADSQPNSEPRYMSAQFRQQLSALCEGSVSLSDISADQLIKRDQASSSTSHQAQGAKTTSSTD
ncbi:hypothetical protein [Marinobacter sp.]|uniref:hypothetical protein n=1 Tax=Marinobacter sp. TaxID=50741 RepID=UPI001A09549F|nr:hypothetical protein [Marinobacter sp.]MBE0486784.1 hypothetical protein [Marinobacter sp.]